MDTATNTPAPTQEEIASTVVPPTATVCRGGRIEGFAWVDANGNDKRDENDLPVAGATIVLEDEARQLVGTVITDDDGRYEFGQLPAGIYFLAATPPAGFEAITSQAWGIDLVCATISRDFTYRPAPTPTVLPPPTATWTPTVPPAP